MIAAVSAGVGWTVLLLAQYYYVIRADIGPSWHDFLLGQLRGITYVPRLFVQGTAVRDLAMGHVIASFMTAATLTAVLAGVLLLSRRLPLPQANVTLMK